MSNAAAVQLAQIIDEFGEIERQLVPYRHLVSKREDLRKKIEAHTNESPAEETLVLEGNVYRVIAGPRAIRRAITNMLEMFKRIGQKKFFEICTVSLTKLDALAIDTSGLVSEDRLGPRTLQPVLKDVARVGARVKRSKAKPNAA